MCARMKINQKTADESRAILVEAINKISDYLEDREFMVGDSFSRADIAIVSLLTPIFQPRKYGLSWPKSLPLELQNFQNEMLPKLTKVIQIYENYR